MGNTSVKIGKKKPKETTKEDREFDRYVESFLYDLTYDPKNPLKGKVVPTKKQKKGVRKRMKERNKKHPSPPEIVATPKIKTPKVPLEQKSVVIEKPKKQTVIHLDDQTTDEEEEMIPKSSELNERVEKAMERTDKLKKIVVIPTRFIFQPVLMEGKQKQMLYINPSDESIQMCHYAIVQSVELPKWAWTFTKLLTADKDTLYFSVRGKDVPFAWHWQKRNAVKNMFFDPKGASTIQPITDDLRDKFCNITKGDVTRILRTLEVYQLNFGRRRPPKVLGRMNMKQPGILACDMFFPSKGLGWRKMNCLAVMDTWSRFCRCYALETKALKGQIEAITLFTNEFTALGHIPRRMLADKGTDIAGAKTVMENYRLTRDKDTPMVLHTATGTPIQIIEAMNAQIQRRMQVFRTAGLTNDPSVILTDICDQINNQRRPDRGNLTPLQLLSLTADERKHVNSIYSDRTEIPEVQGLPQLFVGNFVRILQMKRKEQITNSIKGFAPKWSKDVHVVRKKTVIAKNKDHFRYYLQNVYDFYYRHELLKIPKLLDKKVIGGKIKKKEEILNEDVWTPPSDYDSAEDTD